MRQILALSALLVLVGCATTPTGEWKYLPVDGFFKSDITESELGLLLRQSELKCENELIKLKNQILMTHLILISNQIMFTFTTTHSSLFYNQQQKFQI